MKLVVGMIGFGVVGSAVLEMLYKNAKIIAARAGREIVIKHIIVRDKAKAHKRLEEILKDFTPPFVPSFGSDYKEIIADSEIDMVLELMGGVAFAYEIAQATLKANKSFVTANKAMLAYHRYDLLSLLDSQTSDSSPKIGADTQRGFGFEASVCGGIPIINALKNGLSANEILSIRGILNGTSNYILTQMQECNQDFATALKDAQNLGYAEADPSLDINGGDAGHKLLILASLAYGIKAKPEDILIEGIEGIMPDDIEFAKEFGYVIKLLGIAKREGECVELRVHPAMIPSYEMISKVDGVMNGISVLGNYAGESMYYGAGAGGNATASSVISDMIAIARGEGSIGFRHGENTTLKPTEEIYSRYYIRLYGDDKPGVLGNISQILGKHNISISAFLQKETEDKRIAKMLFSTHHCYEKNLKEAMQHISELSSIVHKPYTMRLED